MFKIKFKTILSVFLVLLVGISLIVVFLINNPKTNKSATQNEVVDNTALSVYNLNYSKSETIKEKVKVYENYLFSYLLGVNMDASNVQSDGEFVGAETLKSLYGVDYFTLYEYYISYYYDDAKEQLTQVLLAYNPSKRTYSYLFTTYDKDGGKVNQYMVSKGAYL